MIKVNFEDMADAYAVFIKVFGFEAPSWNSMFEFSAAIGFSAISCWPVLSEDLTIKVSPQTATWIAWLTGPHRLTMAKVLKSKRYSFYGRLSSPIIKAWHITRYAYLTIVSFFGSFFRAFKYDDNGLT